jgi:hypothetical protein
MFQLAKSFAVIQLPPETDFPESDPSPDSVITMA